MKPLKLTFLVVFIFVFRGINVIKRACGSVGRAVASITRGTWFKTSHWQNFTYTEHVLKNEN